MIALLLLSIFIIALVLLMGVGGILYVSHYAGGMYKKHPRRPWAVTRPGMRTAYYATEEEARNDAKDNLVLGGRGKVVPASEL